MKLPKNRATMVLLCGLLMFFTSACSSKNSENDSDIGSESSSVSQAEALSSTSYADTIFDSSYVHKINVVISQDDWADLLENPTDKTKYSTTVTIDEVTLEEVSFATKGNTSLSQVAQSDSDRYSFKLNFGKFVDGQTFNGLDKLNLNNTYSDATYMKDYMSYRIMAEAGADAPLVSFVSLSINGEPYGLYVAVEEIGDSFLARNYGVHAGELYKPETGQLANMRGNQPEMGQGQNRPDFQNNKQPSEASLSPEQGEERPSSRSDDVGGGGDIPDGGGSMPGGGMSGNAQGADLVYTDDEFSSYSNIFDNAETKPDDDAKQRVITALKQLSSGEDLETCINVEAVLRYFTAHNFIINFDSYTGSMLHNYYLYEEDGRLNMLPWDYNLAFGGFSAGGGGPAGDSGTSAASVINYPIDSPLGSNISAEDRPMWGNLAANEAYLGQYHSYFDQLLTSYFESGRFAEEVDTLYSLIRPYVETDPTAFYTVDQFDTAIETLKTFCILRAESIRGQLNGTIPSTAQGQKTDSSSLVDAGELNTSDMGQMNFGRSNRDGGFSRQSQNKQSDRSRKSSNAEELPSQENESESSSTDK